MDGIWDTIRTRIDYASFVPRPTADLERVELRHRDGRPYTMIKNPHGDRGAGTYLRLEPEDAALLDLMDGTRSIQDILVESLQRGGGFALDRLARLTAALAANGFFGEERPRVYERLRLRRALRDPITRASLLMRRLITWDVARWNNADAFVGAAYRAGGRLAFTRAGAALITLVCLAGIAAWIGEVRAGRHSLVTIDGSYTLGIVALILLQVLSISVHEAGHALAIRHYSRRVRRLGLAIYYLFPCLYVDSTDMTMSSRRARIVVSLAGPMGGLVVGSVCAFVSAVEGGTIGGIAFKGASLFLFQFALNLLPILELDGYHVLTDVLDAPLLRQRALAFARTSVVRKLRRRERWTRTETGLGVYGVLAIVTSVLMVVVSLAIWQTRVATAAGELVASGPLGLVALGALVLVFIGPLLLALVARLIGWWRTIARSAAVRAQRAERAALEERARALARVPFLAGLSGPSLLAIASHLRGEHVAAGTNVVTIGEPGERFYLIREGELQALDADGRSLSTMRPGEGFGELALLDRSPRKATVRALVDSELWSLDRGHFERWIRDRYEVAARIRASAVEREELARLPFFKGLEPAELDRILPRLFTVHVKAGDAVFREGDPGDRYFIVRGGEAEVAVAGRTVTRIGPGAGFGEMALLYGRPRSATVTATTDLSLAALGRSEFAWLVRESGETTGEFRARTAHYVGAAPGLGAAVKGT